MWQQGFNNKITQTNSGLAGGIPRLGESLHPLLGCVERRH